MLRGENIITALMENVYQIQKKTYLYEINEILNKSGKTTVIDFFIIRNHEFKVVHRNTRAEGHNLVSDTRLFILN